MCKRRFSYVGQTTFRIPCKYLNNNKNEMESTHIHIRSYLKVPNVLNVFYLY